MGKGAFRIHYDLSAKKWVQNSTLAADNLELRFCRVVAASVPNLGSLNDLTAG